MEYEEIVFHANRLAVNVSYVYYSMLITYNNNRFQISDLSGLQLVLGKYFNHIMLTTDGDSLH